MADRAERWEKNMKNLQSGGFGDTTQPETLLNYWKAQESAGYPYASENVKYFEDVIMGTGSNRDEEIEKMAFDLNNIICFKDNGFVARYATAEAFYNAGYRKASEVAAEVVEEFKQLTKQYLFDRGLYLVAFKNAIANAEDKIKKKYIQN